MQNLYIGVMSGTSMDGVDIALVNIEQGHVCLIASECYSIPNSLKQNLLTLCETKQTTLQLLGELDNELGLLFAKCVNQFLADNQCDKTSIRAIGCHGQTIYHAPVGQYPFTMQIGDANIIAAKTGITTIADFRRKDMAYGGQGAPLVPAFHKAILQDQDKNRIILNIGGISNITVLIPNRPVIGYDTGPGNVLLDGFIHQHQAKAYDKDALWAKTGQYNIELLNALLDEDYFQCPAPKSTGREQFNMPWLHQKLSKLHSIKAQDIQATLVELTARSIAHEIEKCPVVTELPCELFVCGGGAKNPLIMERLACLLPAWTVCPTGKLAINSDYMEAMAFAWLAYCRLNDIPSNIPEVTGASQAVCLGVIYR